MKFETEEFLLEIEMIDDKGPMEQQFREKFQKIID